MNLRHCPRCSSEVMIQAVGPSTCSCGWVDPTREKLAIKRLEKHSSVYLALIAIALGVVFHHVDKWGANTVTVPTLQVAQLAGMLPVNGYQTLAQAYIHAGDFDRAEKILGEAFEKKHSLEALSELGSLEMSLKKSDDAFVAFDRYFKSGGKNGSAMLTYAILLETRDHQKAALKFYESSIAAMPDRLPLQAMGGIVRILIKQGRYTEAHSRLLGFYDSAGNAKGYFNTEFEKIKGLLRAKAGRMVAGKRTG